jgi:large subunit ribosomal protein L32
MAVPKQHDSKGKVGRRRSQKKMKRQDVLACPFCKAPTLPHRACPNCGKKPSTKYQNTNKS